MEDGTVNVLALSTNDEILEVMLRLLNDREHIVAEGTTDITAAKDWLAKGSYRAVLLGSGFSDEEERELREYTRLHSPRTKIIEHYGGGSGLLSAELEEALK